MFTISEIIIKLENAGCIKDTIQTPTQTTYLLKNCNLNWIGEEAVTGFIPNRNITTTIIWTKQDEKTKIHYYSINNNNHLKKHEPSGTIGSINLEKLQLIKINKNITNEELIDNLTTDEWYPHMKHHLYKMDQLDYLDNTDDDYTRSTWQYNSYLFYEYSADNIGIHEYQLIKTGKDKTHKWFK